MRLIQRSLIIFYAAVGIFVLASVVTGGAALLDLNVAALPVLLAIAGALLLSYGSLLLTYEARLSSQVTRTEMVFLERLGDHYAGLYLDRDEVPDASQRVPGRSPG